MTYSSLSPISPETPPIHSSFHALSDPLRLQILHHLRSQELCVCDLCELLDVSQSKLSFHLKTLKDSQLVKVRQQSRWSYYSLNLSQFLKLEEYLSQFRRFSDVFPSRTCPEPD